MGEQFKKNKYILALKKQLKPMINQPLFEKSSNYLALFKVLFKEAKSFSPRLKSICLYSRDHSSKKLSLFVRFLGNYLAFNSTAPQFFSGPAQFRTE
ncbi:hypothetical protein [Acinetobacter indicus]|uniref:hypothetical protein n=1 Tax=Acinetobacter indicus TaxID=756892 RepID=UPI000CECC5DB|nr:hypothetical protein [Acinetobacter indicus]